VYCSKGYNSGDVRAAIAKGYVYASTPLAVGQQVEPGPAGGHGMMTQTGTDNPAAGVQHAAITIPTGALWKVIGYSEVVTTFTAAAKSISINIVGISNNLRIGRSINFTPAAAAGRIDAYIGAPSTLDTVLNGIVFPMAANIYVYNGDTVSVVLNGIAGGDDLAAGNLNVEEWVMPN
jgi:hypothetical protein